MEKLPKVKTERKIGNDFLEVEISITNVAEYAHPYALDKNEILCILDVPFPSNYRRTKLRDHAYKIQKNWGMISKKGEEVLAKAALTYNRKRNDVWLGIYVYANNPLVRNIILRSERDCCKGLGKELVCLGLRTLIDNRIIKNSKETKFKLEAGGGECNDNKEIKMTEEDIYNFLQKFPENAKNKKTKKERKNEVCAIIANLKLVEYYKTWGLRITNKEDGRAILMEGKMTNVLKKVCQ